MYHYFTAVEMMLLLRIIIAHLLVKYVIPFQALRLKGISEKYTAFLIIVPVITEAVAVYLMVAQWHSIWIVPYIIIISSLSKNNQETPRRFAISELIFMSGAVFAWLFLISGFACAAELWTNLMQNTRIGWIFLGYIICLWPIDKMVTICTRKWRLELPEIEGLNEAGKWIGKLERILILTFVLLGHFESIGFLITAKSILRFNDLKQSTQKKEAEYILIGTLMSFSACIILGLLILKLSQNS